MNPTEIAAELYGGPEDGRRLTIQDDSVWSVCIPSPAGRPLWTSAPDLCEPVAYVTLQYELDGITDDGVRRFTYRQR